MRRLLLAAVLLSAFAVTPAEAQPSDSCQGVSVNDPRATDDADFLSGDAGRDVVALGDGADQYFAFDGNDVLCGNAGNDVLVGESEDDELYGGDGDDLLVGRTGADILVGNGGADEFQGNGGPDLLRASVVDDTRDDLYDGTGEDRIIGNAEDFWHRCDDGDPDDHDQFFGQIVPDPDCP